MGLRSAAKRGGFPSTLVERDHVAASSEIPIVLVIDEDLARNAIVDA
jgi:hypothetical protein